jgi:SAM-dependent methyltransferase
MVATALLAFVRANLPTPPVRLLEIGAGDGALARALVAAGYEVVAINPGPAGPDVRPVSLHELDEPAGSFDAAVAITSLHHVEPLADSLRRLAQLLAPGGVLVLDEFDVGAFDERAAAWWLRQRQTLGAAERASAKELVDEHLAHLHRSSGSSPGSSRTFRSERRSTAPTSTAGTSTSPSAPTKKSRSRAPRSPRSAHDCSRGETRNRALARALVRDRGAPAGSL